MMDLLFNYKNRNKKMEGLLKVCKHHQYKICEEKVSEYNKCISLKCNISKVICNNCQAEMFIERTYIRGINRKCNETIIDQNSCKHRHYMVDGTNKKIGEETINLSEYIKFNFGLPDKIYWVKCDGICKRCQNTIKVKAYYDSEYEKRESKWIKAV